MKTIEEALNNNVIVLMLLCEAGLQTNIEFNCIATADTI